MTTTTRSVLLQDILNLLNPLVSPRLGALIMPLTASGGSTTTAAIDLLERGSGDVDDYNGVTIENITDAGAVIIAAVTDAGFSTKTLTFTPAMTNAVATSDELLLYAPGLSPEQFKERIDRTLLSTEAPYLYWPSMVNDDANYLTGTVADEWIDIAGGTVTQTYDTADDFVMSGERSLKVVTSGVTDIGVTSRNIAVTERESVLISVFVACPTGSMIVQLYDVTNSQEIEASGTYDDPDFNEIRFTTTIPDNCELMTVRYLNKTATSTFYVAQGMPLQSLSGRIYRLPSWVEHPGMIRQSVELPVGMGGEALFSYLAQAKPFDRGPPVEFIYNPLSITEVSAKFAASSRPVALLAYRAFAALASNTATTTCDRSYLVHKVASRICRLLGDDAWRGFARTAKKRARTKGYGPKTHIHRESPKTALVA